MSAMLQRWLGVVAIGAMMMGAGCEIEPRTGLPVFDSPSTGGPGISTVPAMPPSPLTSEYPKTAPLDQLNPETGKAYPWLSREAYTWPARD